MTNLPFSRGARVAIAIARAIAPADGHTDVTALHLAIGILQDEVNPAVAALGFLGVSLPSLRRDLQRALPERGRAFIAEPLLPQTPGEDVIVRGAAAVATEWRDEHLGPQHLLAALLLVEDGEAARVFAAHGVTAKGFEAKAREIVVRHPP